MSSLPAQLRKGDSLEVETAMGQTVEEVSVLRLREHLKDTWDFGFWENVGFTRDAYQGPILTVMKNYLQENI